MKSGHAPAPPNTQRDIPFSWCSTTKDLMEGAGAEDYRVRSDSQAQRYCDARRACLFRGVQLATIDAIRPGTLRRFLLWCLLLCFAFNSSRASADQKRDRVWSPSGSNTCPHTAARCPSP
jgi:hypothetical protein